MPEDFFALVRAVGSTQAADGQLINRGSILVGDNRLSSTLKIQDPTQDPPTLSFSGYWVKRKGRKDDVTVSCRVHEEMEL